MALPSTLSIAVALGVAAIFIAAAIWVYYAYLKPTMDKGYVENKEFIDTKSAPREATLLFFSTEWCPHCKTATAPWEAYKKSMGGDGAIVNDVVIHFREVDCDKEPAVAAQYGIKGYPTIKFEEGKRVVEFDSKPTVPLLTEFVAQMTSGK